MEPNLARFAELLSRDDREIAIDEACFLIDAVIANASEIGTPPHPGDHPATRRDDPIAPHLEVLDDLAASVSEPTLDGLTRRLFDELEYRGNRDDYYNPANSLLPSVIRNRTGIPILLSVLMMEVGRRIQVPLVGVGMPGHFLVRDQVDKGMFVDPFHGGARLREADCERLFQQLHGPHVAFTTQYLLPVPRLSIVVRVLNNLLAVARQQKDRPLLAAVLLLRTNIEGLPNDEHTELAAALTSLGRFDAAAETLESFAVGAEPESAERAIAEAMNLRARLN